MADLNLTGSETVSAGESLASYSDQVDVHEQAVLFVTCSVSVSDTVSTAGMIGLLVVSFIPGNDTATTSENVVAGMTNFITVSDTTATSDSLLLLDGDGIGSLDTTVLSESVAVQVSCTVLASDTATMTESVSVIIASIVSVSDTVSSGEFLGFVYARTDDLNIQITQTNLTTETHDNLLTEDGNLIATEQDGEQIILNESVIALLSGGSVSLSFLTIELLKLEVQPIALTLVQSVPILVTVVIA